MKKHIKFDKSLGHPDFELNFPNPNTIDCDVEWLTEYLKQSVENGNLYKPDQTVQIGWMICKVVERPSGALALYEPDFKEFPIQWVNSCSNTILHVRIQKAVLESVNLLAAMDFPSLAQSGLVCNKFYDSPHFLGSRSEHDKPGDSGWYIGCTDPDHDHNNPANLKRESLYALALAQGTVIPFLALPAETEILFKRGTAELFYKQKRLHSKPGSYLAERFSKRL